MLSGAAARAMEPALRVDSALHSPETGIVDSHALMLAYQGDMEAAGGTVAVHAPLLGGAVGRAASGWTWAATRRCSWTAPSW